jgi:hypothetical protein
MDTFTHLAEKLQGIGTHNGEEGSWLYSARTQEGKIFFKKGRKKQDGTPGD